ncbi:glutathione S-transferase N-terminal domain-containing protein [soil metagenome]
MIELYTWGTPNGKKVPIFLEEAEVPYDLHRVDISKGEQHAPEYLAKNPNGRIPALVDGDAGVTIFESGAILLYLADKYGKLIPKDAQGRASALAWLMFQMSAIGPMMGQVGYFDREKKRNAGAIERFTVEVKRIFGVLETHLAKTEYLAGEYSIADIASYPWVSAYDFLKLDITPYPHVKAWIDKIAARPAVKKALDRVG